LGYKIHTGLENPILPVFSYNLYFLFPDLFRIPEKIPVHRLHLFPGPVRYQVKNIFSQYFFFTVSRSPGKLRIDLHHRSFRIGQDHSVYPYFPDGAKEVIAYLISGKRFPGFELSHLISPFLKRCASLKKKNPLLINE
jgi:hypothetical protein